VLRSRTSIAALAVLSGACVSTADTHGLRAKVLDAITQEPISHQAFLLTFDNASPTKRRPAEHLFWAGLSFASVPPGHRLFENPP
jgi:hypothetical protein